MPNIVFEKLRDFRLPFGNSYARFLSKFDGKDGSLILTQVGSTEFFIFLRPKESGYVLKSDKLTRPADISLLHKALIGFEEAICGVKFSTLKDKERIKKDGFVVEVQKFLELIRSAKFEKIFVEIGFGSGRHLLYQANANKDTLVIGIEVYTPSILQVANLASEQGLENVILLNLDARLVLSLIDSNLVDRVFLHFPVPWPKSPKRRVVSEVFIKEVRRVLKFGGSFELRSDEFEYVEFTENFIKNLDKKELVISKNQNLEISSKYEDRWKRLNKDIFDLVFTNFYISQNLDLSGNFDFDCVTRETFSDLTLKFQDHFVHIEECFVNGNEKLIRLAMGSFYRPEHLYVLIKNAKAKYFLKQPLLTSENLKSHKALKEYLSCNR